MIKKWKMGVLQSLKQWKKNIFRKWKQNFSSPRNHSKYFLFSSITINKLLLRHLWRSRDGSTSVNGERDRFDNKLKLVFLFIRRIQICKKCSESDYGGEKLQISFRTLIKQNTFYYKKNLLNSFGFEGLHHV